MMCKLRVIGEERELHMCVALEFTLAHGAWDGGVSTVLCSK